MLESMGWQDGQGLGKHNTGMTKAIEVKKKEDTSGVRVFTSASRAAPAPDRRSFFQVGKAVGWQWDKKYWEDAYNSVNLVINKVRKGLDSLNTSAEPRKARPCCMDTPWPEPMR